MALRVEPPVGARRLDPDGRPSLTQPSQAGVAGRPSSAAHPRRGNCGRERQDRLSGCAAQAGSLAEQPHASRRSPRD